MAMRRWLFYLRVCVSLGLLPGRLAAQAPPAPALTIVQAVQEALDHNLNLLAERYNVSVAEARIITARLRPNPVLSSSANIVDRTIFRSGTNPYDEALRLDYVFERRGKWERRIEVAEQARQVAHLQLLNTIRTLMLDVQNAGVEVLLAKANIALAQENLRTLNEVVDINTHRVRAGDLAEVELERTRLAALQFQNQVRQSEANLLIGRKELQVLVGRPLQTETVDVAGELRRDGQPASVDGVLQQALTWRPDLQALVQDQARSAAELRLQIAQGKVDYTIGAEYHRQQGNAQEGSVFSLYFSTPLPVFNRNQGEIERARQEQEQLTVKLRALEADIRKEVQTAYQQYTTAQEVVQRTETEMLERAGNVRDTIEYSYKRGQASLLEFLDAQRASNETRQSYNEARAAYARSLYLIESVFGASVMPGVVSRNKDGAQGPHDK